MMITREDILTELAIAGALESDEKSFRLLYRQWNPALSRYASGLTRNPDAVPDVMQEAWISIAKGLNRLKDAGNFKPWAYRIVSNKCHDWIRTQQSRRRIDLETIENPRMDELDSSNGAIVNLRKSIALLEKNQRIILTFFYMEEMSVHEISALLDVPEGTVKSRLYNARRTLKGVLENQNNE